MKRVVVTKAHLAGAAAIVSVALVAAAVAAPTREVQGERQLPPAAFGLPSRLVTRLITPPIVNIIGEGGERFRDPFPLKVACSLLNLGDRPVQASFILHGAAFTASRVLLADVTIDPGLAATAIETNLYLGGVYCSVELAGAIDRNTVRVTMQTYFTYDFADEKDILGPLLEGR